MSLPFHPASNDNLGMELPPGVSLPAPPPRGFNPLRASNDDLIRHGLPPRPTGLADESPDELVWWEKICSNAGSFVTPSFEPLPARTVDVGHGVGGGGDFGGGHDTGGRGDGGRGDGGCGGGGRGGGGRGDGGCGDGGRGCGGRGGRGRCGRGRGGRGGGYIPIIPPSRNWSGAVISATKGYQFNSVRASWTVSRPHPDNWAWREPYWEPSRFTTSTWVGIDGYNNNYYEWPYDNLCGSTKTSGDDVLNDNNNNKEYGNFWGSSASGDVLQAGVGHACIVSTHQDTEYSTHPWWGWGFTERPWAITGFQIATGDLVSVTIRAKSPTSASILFNNLSACTYTSFDVTAPGGVRLEGTCAEWIVEAHRSEPTMSYLGATFFFDCGATEKKASGGPLSHSMSRNLRGAKFLEIEQSGQVLSAANKALSNDTVLGVVAERRLHTTRIEPYTTLIPLVSRRFTEYLMPKVAETHEFARVPGTNFLLLSQMSDSQLIKIELDPASEEPLALRSFPMGSSKSMLHGVWPSKVYPGKMWLSLQSDNKLLLIDPGPTLITIPTVLKTIDIPDPGNGPHCVFEIGHRVWAGLKVPSKNKDKKFYVFSADVANTADKKLYECLDSPVFIKEDPDTGLIYVTQDNKSSIMRIDLTTDKTSQLEIPPKFGNTPVGMVTVYSGPLRGVWFTLAGDITGGTGTFGRIVSTITTSNSGSNSDSNSDSGSDSSNNNNSIEILYFFTLQKPLLGTNASLLHLADATSQDGAHPALWLLSSSLISPEHSADALIRVTFDEAVTKVADEEYISLPTQNAKAHRVVPLDATVLVSELHTFSLAQLVYNNTAAGRWLPAQVT